MRLFCICAEFIVKVLNLLAAIYSRGIVDACLNVFDDWGEENSLNIAYCAHDEIVWPLV